MTETVTTWAREILSVALLLPLAWYFIKTNQKNVEANLQTVKDGFQSITDALVNHMEDDKYQFERIVSKVGEVSRSIGKTSLSNSQIIEIARSRVWLTSEKKLDFIKKRLKKNNLQERQDIIRKQVRTELERLSEQYVDFLNGFTSEVGLVGDWIEENFPMDEFMEEIFDVIFEPIKPGKTKEECVNLKINDCRFIMSAYQNDMWQLLKSKLK